MGWVVLSLILTLLFGTELASYLTRDTKKSSQFVHVEQVFEEDLKYRESLNALGAKMEASDKDVVPLLNQLAPNTTTSARAAMLYAAILFEQGNQSKPSDLAVLKAGTARERAFHEIYSHQVLRATDLPAIKASLSDSKFLDRLALAHALEKAGKPNPRAGLFSQAQKSGLFIVIGVAVTAFVLGLFALLFIMATSVGRPLPGHATGSITLGEADGLALRVALLLSLYLGVSVFIALVLRTASTNVTFLVDGLLIIAGTVAICRAPILLKSQGPVSGLREIGVQKPTFRLIGWGAIGALANAPIVVVVTLLSSFLFKALPPAEHPIEQMLRSPSPWTLAVLFFAASIQAPFFEEILFRGTMLPAMARVFKSPIWAGVVSSCLFAMIHPTGIPAWPGLAAIGGMSAFLSYRTGSLVPSMVMHCLNNAVVLALSVAMN